MKSYIIYLVNPVLFDQQLDSLSYTSLLSYKLSVRKVS